MSKPAPLFAVVALVLLSIIVLLDLVNTSRRPLRSEENCEPIGKLTTKTLKVPSVQDVVAMYNTIFEEDVSDEISQVQKELRISQDCQPPPESETPHRFPTTTDHPDSIVATISCTRVHYRAPMNSFVKLDSIVFGVLSNSRERRDSIRQTWAQGNSVFFIVAGNWDLVEAEYYELQDIIWVDQEEYDIYTWKTFRSGSLTVKTNTFFLVAHNQIMELNKNVQYFFKADDDSYIDIETLRATILSKTPNNAPIDYWGRCVDKVKPPRVQHERGFVPFEQYPFTYYPPLCLGNEGYAVSPEFLRCAVGQGHIERVRYLTIEDGNTGLLAERCGIRPNEFWDADSKVVAYKTIIPK